MLEGSHRMQRDWIEDRTTWLGEDGMPKPISGEDWDNNFEEEQTYLRKEGQERMLETWKYMLQNEELTQTQLDEMKQEPWFALAVQEFQDHVEVRKEYLELIKTPEDLRKDAGVDEYLTTQRRRDHKTYQRAKHKKKVQGGFEASKAKGHGNDEADAQGRGESSSDSEADHPQARP